MTEKSTAAAKKATAPRKVNTTRKRKGARKTRRTAFREAFPGYLGIAFVAASVMTVIFGIVPYIIIGLAGVISGNFPSSDQGGIYGVAPGYPWFQPPFWLLWIPAVIMFVLSIVTIPMASKLDSLFLSARGDLAVFAFLGLTVTLLFTLRGFVDYLIAVWQLWGPGKWRG